MGSEEIAKASEPGPSICPICKGPLIADHGATFSFCEMVYTLHGQQHHIEVCDKCGGIEQGGAK